MTSTPRFKWTIPRKDSDNWYEPFVTLQNSVDTSTFANTEDRNAVCMGGGNFDFTLPAGLVAWDGTIEILSANSGFVRQVAPGSVVLEEGELLIVELPRFPPENSVVSAFKVSNLSVSASINDSFVLAVRRNNLIYFRNGRNMQDGDSFKVFETTGTGGGSGGSVSTSSPVSGDGTPGTPITIGANTITNAKLATMPTLTLKGNNTGGFGTPVDLTALQSKSLLGLADVATTGSATDLVDLATVALTGNAADLSGLAAIAITGSASDLTSGTVAAARTPALTGDVTTTAGTVATTIGVNKVLNSMLAQMPTLTLKGNNTGGTANVLDLTVAEVVAMLGVAIPGSGQFGDASDGSATMDGAATVTAASRSGSIYTLTRDAFYLNLTINNAVVLLTDGYTLCVRGTLTNNGQISVNGSSAVGQTAGAASSAGNRPLPVGLTGGTGGGSQANGTSANANAASCPQSFSTTAAAGGTPGVAGTAGGLGHGGGGGGSGSVPVGGLNAGFGGAVTLSPTQYGDVRLIRQATEARNMNGSAYTCGSAGGGGAGDPCPLLLP